MDAFLFDVLYRLLLSRRQRLTRFPNEGDGRARKSLSRALPPSSLIFRAMSSDRLTAVFNRLMNLRSRLDKEAKLARSNNARNNSATNNSQITSNRLDWRGSTLSCPCASRSISIILLEHDLCWISLNLLKQFSTCNINSHPHNADKWM